MYRDDKGGWSFEAASHKDPVTGKWKQVTRRGFVTAAEADRIRQDFLDEPRATPRSAVAGPTVTELVKRHLEDYITPWIGSRLVRVGGRRITNDELVSVFLSA